jgi:hypothetical protein
MTTKEKEIVCTHSKANGCYREWREGVGGIRVPPQKNYSVLPTISDLFTKDKNISNPLLLILINISENDKVKFST